jgi:MFS family permease
MTQVGPVELAPGISRTHFWALMYAAFITIGMLAGINILQSWVLTEHLRLSPDIQGTAAGNLILWQEVIAILLIKPWGILADRIGRRPVMIAGIIIVAAGFALFPFATTLTELTAYRALFAAGAAALAGVLPVVSNDYPAEPSRGRLQGFSAVMNALGVVFVALLLARLPLWLQPRGVDPVAAGQIMFLCAAALCLLSALVFRVGLKGGTPVASAERRGVGELLASGMRAARNPRIALSFACAFVGRADNTLKGTFVGLWAVLAAPAAGLSVAEGLARGGQVTGFMSVVAMAWAPLFGLFLDRVNRVTGVAVAMGLAGLGFLSMALITSPLDRAMWPAFALLSIGQISAILASVTLVGQEADVAARGSVIALNGWCGAVGILVAGAVGGRLFDAVGPAAPFVAFGTLQLALCALALLVRWRYGSPRA